MLRTADTTGCASSHHTPGAGFYPRLRMGAHLPCIIAEEATGLVRPGILCLMAPDRTPGVGWLSTRHPWDLVHHGPGPDTRGWLAQHKTPLGSCASLPRTSPSPCRAMPCRAPWHRGIAPHGRGKLAGHAQDSFVCHALADLDQGAFWSFYRLLCSHMRWGSNIPLVGPRRRLRSLVSGYPGMPNTLAKALDRSGHKGISVIFKGITLCHTSRDTFHASFQLLAEEAIRLPNLVHAMSLGPVPVPGTSCWTTPSSRCSKKVGLVPRGEHGLLRPGILFLFG
jgi:hypothetical protein